MGPGLRDIAETCRRPALVFYMAWSEIRARYKRSVLGPGWITVSTAIGVVGLGFVWSALFHMDRAAYIPPLTIGLVLWQFMAGCVTESAGLFARQAGIIRNFSLPLSLHAAQLLLRQTINLAHTLPLFFAVMLVLGQPMTAAMWHAIPHFLLVAGSLYWISLIVGIFGARFRDLEYFIATIMPLVMFFSPVMYRSSALPFAERYMWFNPFADMIEFVRYPLLGEATPYFLYASNAALFLVSGLAAIALFNAKRNRIAFWV